MEPAVAASASDTQRADWVNPVGSFSLVFPFGATRQRRSQGVGIPVDVPVVTATGDNGAEPPMPGIQVRRSTLRCPFCHEDCRPRESVACLHCLGRHHKACWLESRTCASCGADEWLVPEKRTGGFLNEPELYALLEAGRGDEVAAYLERCQDYAREARRRTSDLATRLAFERMSETLETLRAFRVVGAPSPLPIPVASPRLRLAAWLTSFREAVRVPGDRARRASRG
jgi:hypothetical protein